MLNAELTVLDVRLLFIIREHLSCNQKHNRGDLTHAQEWREPGWQFTAPSETSTSQRETPAMARKGGDYHPVQQEGLGPQRLPGRSFAILAFNSGISETIDALASWTSWSRLSGSASQASPIGHKVSHRGRIDPIAARTPTKN